MNRSITPIARQLQIDLITDTPNEIITWFKTFCASLTKLQTNVYNYDEEVAYIIESDNNFLKKQVIFYYDTSTLWCDSSYWELISERFDIDDYFEVKNITAVLMELIPNINAKSINSYTCFREFIVGNPDYYTTMSIDQKPIQEIIANIERGLNGI